MILARHMHDVINMRFTRRPTVGAILYYTYNVECY